MWELALVFMYTTQTNSLIGTRVTPLLTKIGVLQKFISLERTSKAKGTVQVVAVRKIEIDFFKLISFFCSKLCFDVVFFNEIGFLVQINYQIILNGTKLFKSQLFSN